MRHLTPGPAAFGLEKNFQVTPLFVPLAKRQGPQQAALTLNIQLLTFNFELSARAPTPGAVLSASAVTSAISV